MPGFTLKHGNLIAVGVRAHNVGSFEKRSISGIGKANPNGLAGRSEVRTIIPQATNYTCDRCGSEGRHYEPGPFNDYAELKINHGGRGLDGSTGGATHNYDLCGRCHAQLIAFLKPFTEQPNAKAE